MRPTKAPTWGELKKLARRLGIKDDERVIVSDAEGNDPKGVLPQAASDDTGPIFWLRGVFPPA